jgi:hypothetical protein
MEDIIEINGMKFEKTRLLPNFQGIYDSDAGADWMKGQIIKTFREK